MALEPPLWLQNLPGGYSARRDRSLLDLLFDEGVATWLPGGLKVTQRAAGANNSVDIAEGGAIVQGDEEPDQGAYYIKSTDGENLAVTAAPAAGAGQHRIDLVYAKVHDSSVTGTADGWTFGVTLGTLVANAVAPPAPATPPSAIPLANLLREAGDVSVTTARIVSRRTAASGAFDDPVGTIRLHYTAAGPVPPGWAVCDGTNGTPDMRGRVPVGAGTGGGATYTEGSVGGAINTVLTVPQLPAHSHPASVSGGAHPHSGNTEDAGVHKHTYSSSSWPTTVPHQHSQDRNYLSLGIPNSNELEHYHSAAIGNSAAHKHPFNTGTTGSHGHTLSVGNTGQGGAVDLRQPFRVVTYIMRLPGVVIL
jgi:microcystin-dependent protein